MISFYEVNRFLPLIHPQFVMCHRALYILKIIEIAASVYNFLNAITTNLD